MSASNAVDYDDAGDDEESEEEPRPGFAGFASTLEEDAPGLSLSKGSRKRGGRNGRDCGSDHARLG